LERIRRRVNRRIFTTVRASALQNGLSAERRKRFMTGQRLGRHRIDVKGVKRFAAQTSIQEELRERSLVNRFPMRYADYTSHESATPPGRRPAGGEPAERDLDMTSIDPEDATLLFFWLWSLRDWTEEEMATITDLAPETIERFQEGDEVPSEATLERLTAAVGLPIPFIHAILLPMFTMARHVMSGMRQIGRAHV
jgi:hypothetical protein